MNFFQWNQCARVHPLFLSIIFSERMYAFLNSLPLFILLTFWLELELSLHSILQDFRELGWDDLRCPSQLWLLLDDESVKINLKAKYLNLFTTVYWWINFVNVTISAFLFSIIFCNIILPSICRLTISRQIP